MLLINIVGCMLLCAPPPPVLSFTVIPVVALEDVVVNRVFVSISPALASSAAGVSVPLMFTEHY
jgi:hypothetical protein